MQEYIVELAAEAQNKIDETSWEKNEELKRHLPTKPVDSGELARKLMRNPLLQATLAAITGYTPSKWLLKHELDEVRQRRRAQKITPVTESEDPYRCASEMGLMGLCFSGGGIRSATFNLGVLQGLAELGILPCFDYLASVSGGGYIHQFLAAWSHRKSFAEVCSDLIPLPDAGCPKSHPEPIRWLRRYSNYLTPQLGMFSGDTWVMIATWVRNALLNQAILCSTLLALMLVLLSLPRIASHVNGGPVAATVTGVLFALLIASSGFAGRNLLQFGGNAERARTLHQSRVQVTVIVPLLVGALMAAMLIPLLVGDLIGIHLILSFFCGSALLFLLALCITFGGGAHLCFVQRLPGASGFKTFSEFWHQKPKCAAHIKAALAVSGFILAGLAAAVAGGAWIVAAEYGMIRLWHQAGQYWLRLMLVAAPPLILGGALVTIVLLAGLLGRSYFDSRKEWVARLLGWNMFYAIAWVVATGIALFSYSVAVVMAHYGKSMAGTILAWIGTTAGGILAANGSKTAGASDDKQASKFSLNEILATIAPYVFIVGLLAFVSIGAERISRSLSGWEFIVPILVAAAIAMLLAWRVDINEFSMQAFYRNRLARCYLGASNASREPDPFTGFDEKDDGVLLSHLRVQNQYMGPFPIFCAALNLTFGQDLAWQERKAASFVFTPLYSGYDVPYTASRPDQLKLRFNAYAKTETYAFPKPGIHISTASAISGAAMSPNQGFHSSPATAFLLTVFNVRLGWWMANPRTLSESGRLLSTKQGVFREDDPATGRRSYPSPSPDFALFYLLSELMGQANDTRDYVYLTDGGHFDNMGLYELVRRRCRFIVISDAEQDGSLQFEGIGMAIRKCRIDFGAEISLDLRPLEHTAELPVSSAHCITGTLRYPDDPPGMPHGIVVYLKSSLTGDEPGDVLNYKKHDSAFPHDDTANQWFSESQFESYRRLGHHIAMSCFAAADPGSFPCSDGTARSQFFCNMRKIWAPVTPEMKQYSVEHSALYAALQEKIRTNSNVASLFDLLFNRTRVTGKMGSPTPSPANLDEEYAIRFCSCILEFIFTIFQQLRLTYPENREHPFAQGWIDIFAAWFGLEVMQKAWAHYGASYTQGFQIFVTNEIL